MTQAGSTLLLIILILTIGEFPRNYSHATSEKQGKLDDLQYLKGTHKQQQNSGDVTNYLPWTECINNSCMCRKSLDKFRTIKCDNKTLQLSVLRCHCVTFNNETLMLEEGDCFENCQNGYEKSEYLPLPLKVSELNQFMCEEKWNRTGRLCGKCLPGHSPLAYSYDMRCVECPEGNRNVWKYILVAFGPLTIFYFLVLIFKIKATSTHLHGYLIFSQIIANHISLKAIPSYIRNYNPNAKVLFQIYITLVAIWNLDFFRMLDLNICLDVSSPTVIALDYAVAIYPLLLTVLSYFLIELHARDVRIVVILWKPFRYLFPHFCRNRDSRTTVIDAYATFTILSFVKIASTSFCLLIPVRVYSLTNDSVKWVLYADATVDYLGSEHLPYAIAAIISSLVITAPLVLLLLIYQLRCFQQLLNYLKIRGRLLLVLMDSFQGDYKNGTEPGTRDYRWFVAVPFIGQILMITVTAFLLDGSIYPLITEISICIIVLTAVVQPYREHLSKQTKIDIAFWGILALFFGLNDAVMYESLKASALIKFCQILRVIVAAIPLLYMICVTAYLILSRVKIAKRMFSHVKAWRRGYVNVETEFEAILPDRVSNPEHY